MKTNRWILTIVILVIGISGLIQPVSAQDNDVSFGVRAILPENQANDGVTYFDIEMKPGQVQELEVVISNTSDEPIKVAVSSNTATTNQNGVISYDGSITDRSETMEHDFTEISKVEESPVEVPANSEESIFVEVTAPEESFDGQILGGLHFLLINEEDVGSEGVSISNQFAYVIGVNIIEEGNDFKVLPEVELVGVTSGLVDHQRGLMAVFSNNAPILVSKLEFVGGVYRQGEDEALQTRELPIFSMAPNSYFGVPLYFEGNQPLEPGGYIYKAVFKNDDYSWEFEQEFVIEEDEVYESIE